tara:strand:+ start:230 stop:439 length:210 start_codon:yes stop_codon:yes gene_type:complete
MNSNQLTDTLSKLNLVSGNSEIVIRGKTYRPANLEESEFRYESFLNIKKISIKYKEAKGEPNQIILEVE